MPETDVQIVEEIRDKRSYRVSFEKIKKELGFSTKKTVKDGIIEVKKAIENGKIINPNDPVYYNYRGE